MTNLDLAEARGEVSSPDAPDEALDLIFRLGLAHEAAYLDKLKASGLSVAEVPADVELGERVRLTQDAMVAGIEVIYQATFVHEGSRGHADFLLRGERPSSLGSYSYDVADTKLARRMKVAALLQMADYGRHLERLQGAPPQWLIVVLGDGSERRFRYADVAAYASRATAALRAAVEEPVSTTPEPVSHCAQCRWAPRCEAQWRAADHLSLVAFMRTDHRQALEAAGITTVAALAAARTDTLPPTIGPPSRLRLHAQAALQMRERHTGTPHYELLPPASGLGLLRLPAPSRGDVYLDFEGDPYADSGAGREYLAGLLDRHGAYSVRWAHSAHEERALVAALLAELAGRLDVDPAMHVYHYGAYERTALERLTQKHSVGERDFDRLLRGETLIDLYSVVRQGLRVSKESYSIKKLESFYWGHSRAAGSGDVADALASVVAYERWLAERDDSILDRIADYNRDDVRSNRALHGWLEERRTELEVVHGIRQRPSLSDGAASPAQTAAEEIEASVAQQLRASGHHLLAGLVGWHRREDKPQWWDFYRVGSLTDDELVRDGSALGGLSAPEEPRSLPKPARSVVWRYRFPPQDTKVNGIGYDVDTHLRLGEIFALDATEGWLDLKVGTGKEPPCPRGLGPSGPPDTGELQRSLQRTAGEVLAGSSPLGQLLIDRVVPAGLRPMAGERPSDILLRTGRALGEAVLAVQGPPGSGKTTVAADLIRNLLDDGLRVGITAQSHAVIGHLLAAVGRPALQKCEIDDHCGAPGVERTGSNDGVADALANGTHRLVGGTAWLWAREQLSGAVDVLVIEEAGQFSLANAVAVSRCARGLVLLGDPQQLAQPSLGRHPDGADVSALAHMLGSDATMPADRGVFLDRTWRMHPSLASVVSNLMYDGRLASAPGRDLQMLHGREPWIGAGIRWVPVVHSGNEAASSEEAAAVQEIVADLLEGGWIDAAGEAHDIALADVLVVAPYNAHVAKLKRVLPPGARVGTVDKFQGQEAPVAIYSMASSSVEEAPRGVAFLFDLHRLNVAISRARCMAIVVGSPALLDAAVGSPDDLRSVNGLISVVEQAGLGALFGRRGGVSVQLPFPAM